MTIVAKEIGTISIILFFSSLGANGCKATTWDHETLYPWLVRDIVNQAKKNVSHKGLVSIHTSLRLSMSSDLLRTMGI